VREQATPKRDDSWKRGRRIYELFLGPHSESRQRSCCSVSANRRGNACQLRGRGVVEFLTPATLASAARTCAAATVFPFAPRSRIACSRSTAASEGRPANARISALQEPDEPSRTPKDMNHGPPRTFPCITAVSGGRGEGPSSSWTPLASRRRHGWAKAMPRCGGTSCVCQILVGCTNRRRPLEGELVARPRGASR